MVSAMSFDILVPWASTLAVEPAGRSVRQIVRLGHDLGHANLVRDHKRITITKTPSFTATFMHLVWQLSNPSPRLQSILDLPASRVKPRATQAQSRPAQGRLGNGVVQRAVMRVLADANGPMRTREVQASVERLLGRPVAKESVSWSLRMGSRGPRPRFECVAYATYRLGRPSRG
jgi:hypothetical protein